MLIVNLRQKLAWKSLYELQIAAMMMFAGFIPFVGILVAVCGSYALLPTASIYGGVLLLVQRRATDWKCPKCRKAFLRNKGDGFAFPFRNYCGNCGVRRGGALS